MNKTEEDLRDYLLNQRPIFATGSNVLKQTGCTQKLSWVAISFEHTSLAKSDQILFPTKFVKHIKEALNEVDSVGIRR